MSNLPFLKAKKIATVIMAKRKPSGEIERTHREDEADPALMNAAEDLISAVHSKDATAVAEALKAAFSIIDSDEDQEKEPSLDDDQEGPQS